MFSLLHFIPATRLTIHLRSSPHPLSPEWTPHFTRATHCFLLFSTTQNPSRILCLQFHWLVIRLHSIWSINVFMITDMHMGKLECQAYKVVPSRGGRQTWRRWRRLKEMCFLASDLCTLYMDRDFPTLDPSSDSYEFGFLTQPIKPIYLYCLHKRFDIVMYDLCSSRRSIHALLCMQDWVSYHQNSFLQIVLWLNKPSNKPLGARVLKFGTILILSWLGQTAFLYLLVAHDYVGCEGFRDLCTMEAVSMWYSCPNLFN